MFFAFTAQSASARLIAAYIPTNLISTTDGQLYLSPTLFELGTLPAVDVAKSVSRVGGKAQLAAYHAIAGSLKLAYSQFEELETFSRFGSRLDESTRNIINHGQRIRACLKQTEFAPVSVVDQITVLLALTEGLFDSVPLGQMREAERTLCAASIQIAADLRGRFVSDQELNEADREAVLKVARQALAPFQKEL